MKRISDIKLSNIAKFNFYRLCLMRKLKLISNKVYSNFLDFAYLILNTEGLGDISRFDVFMIEMRRSEDDSLNLVIFTEIDEVYNLDLEVAYYSTSYLIPAMRYIFGDVYIVNYVD